MEGNFKNLPYTSLLPEELPHYWNISYSPLLELHPSLQSIVRSFHLLQAYCWRIFRLSERFTTSSWVSPQLPCWPPLFLLPLHGHVMIDEHKRGTLFLNELSTYMLPYSLFWTTTYTNETFHGSIQSCKKGGSIYYNPYKKYENLCIGCARTSFDRLFLRMPQFQILYLLQSL